MMIENKRIEGDYYPTPKALVHLGVKLAMDRYAKMNDGIKQSTLSFLDPGCGSDARFASYAVDSCGFGRGTCVDTGDIDQSKISQSAGIEMRGNSDFLSNKCFWEDKYDVICGNPPFTLAEKFVRRSVDLLAPTGVLCFILRLAFWESKERVELFSTPKYMPSQTFVLQQRPSFYSDTGIGKTDGTAYGFFLWDGEATMKVLKGVGVEPSIKPISWR